MHSTNDEPFVGLSAGLPNHERTFRNARPSTSAGRTSDHHNVMEVTLTRKGILDELGGLQPLLGQGADIEVPFNLADVIQIGFRARMGWHK